MRFPVRFSLLALLSLAAVASTPAAASADVDLLSQANIQLNGAGGGDNAGQSVAGAGDVNGDGRADVIVGASLADNNGRSNSGSAYVVFGQAANATVDLAALGTLGYRIDGAVANDTAGRSVAGAGDVNNDGRSDVIVGAPGADFNGLSSGSAYVVFGKTDAASVNLASLGTAGFRIDGAGGSNQAGTSVAGVGDVSGDGLADVIVGSPLPLTGTGAAHVVFGKADSTTVSLATLGSGGFRIGGAVAGDQAGQSVGGAGDVNGDGRPDIVVGANLADNNGRTSSGSAYVVFGKADATAVDLASLGAGGFRIDGAVTGDQAGVSVAVAGDVNGDGRADVIVGVPFADPIGTSSGSAYVVYGKTDSSAVDLNTALGTGGFRIDGAAAGDQAGTSVAGARIDGDGLADVILGAPLADNNGRSNSGSTYVLFGKTVNNNVILSTALGTNGFRIDGAAPNTQSGSSVAAAGDVNTDGRADVIVGAALADNNGRTDSGSAYVVFAPAPVVPVVTTGAASSVTQSEASLAGTVNPGGAATSYVFEYGTSLSFGSITTPDSAGSGSSPVAVSGSLSGLAAGTMYYYRLVATNSQGTAFGAASSFTTTGGVPSAPVVVTSAPSSVTNTSAVLAGTVNPKRQQTTYTFEYGTSTSFGQITPVVALDDADAAEPVSATVSGLTPDTTYYYRTVATNAAGTSVGTVMAFTTGPGGAPIVATGPASAITATGATLSGTVDAHGSPTSYLFEYGTTLSFGQVSAVDSAGSANGAHGVSLPISGLAPNTQYWFRIVASNANGTSTGTVQSFTTGPGT